MEQYDLAILGAGPAGLAAACECQRLGMSHVIIDRRGLVHSFVEYPQTLRFFSPPDEMAIDNVPFPMRGGDKPTREDALAYYRETAYARRLNLATWERVVSVARHEDGFVIETAVRPCEDQAKRRRARAILLATGVWDEPVRLDCPGRDLPHVYSRFAEPTEYMGHPVLVVGGGNSAVTAALALSQAHARVTLAMRRTPVPYQSHLRPFIIRDLEFAVDEGNVDLRTGVMVSRVEPHRSWLVPIEYHPAECRPCGPEYEIPARFVFALLGQRADRTFLTSLELELRPDGRPVCDPETYQTSVPGIYAAGSLVGGDIDIVIKGREQAKRVVQVIASTLGDCA